MKTIVKCCWWDLLRLVSFSMAILGTGCSSISKFTLHKQPHPSEWVVSGTGYSYQHVRLSTPAYGIVRDSMDITAVAGPRVGNPLFFGPLLVPVIPDLILLLPGSSHDQRFTFDLRIQNRAQATRKLDISNIGFSTNGMVREPKRVLSLYHGCFGQRDGAYGCNEYEADPIGDTLVLQPFNTQLIRFCFSEWHADVKGLRVSIDGAIGQEPAPILILQRKSKVKYMPVIFPRFSHFDQ